MHGRMWWRVLYLRNCIGWPDVVETRQELKSEPLEKKITDMIIGSCKAFEVLIYACMAPLSVNTQHNSMPAFALDWWARTKTHLARVHGKAHLFVMHAKLCLSGEDTWWSTGASYRRWWMMELVRMTPALQTAIPVSTVLREVLHEGRLIGRGARNQEQ